MALFRKLILKTEGRLVQIFPSRLSYRSTRSMKTQTFLTVEHEALENVTDLARGRREPPGAKGKGYDRRKGSWHKARENRGRRKRRRREANLLATPVGTAEN
jgi:hypothetical protein